MTASTPRRVIPLHPVPLLPPAPPSPLMQIALKLWPDHLDNAERNRREWLRAVGVVRGTANGWQLDAQTPRTDAGEPITRPTLLTRWLASRNHDGRGTT